MSASLCNAISAPHGKLLRLENKDNNRCRLSLNTIVEADIPTQVNEVKESLIVTSYVDLYKKQLSCFINLKV